MPTRISPARKHALVAWTLFGLTGVVVLALLTVAIVAHAPLAAVPFVATICVGAPMVAALELARVIASPSMESLVLDELRGYLDQLPETHHPLGL